MFPPLAAEAQSPFFAVRPAPRRAGDVARSCTKGATKGLSPIGGAVLIRKGQMKEKPP